MAPHWPSIAPDSPTIQRWVISHSDRFLPFYYSFIYLMFIVMWCVSSFTDKILPTMIPSHVSHEIRMSQPPPGRCPYKCSLRFNLGSVSQGENYTADQLSFLLSTHSIPIPATDGGASLHSGTSAIKSFTSCTSNINEFIKTHRNVVSLSFCY